MIKLFYAFLIAIGLLSVRGEKSAVNLLQDIYSECLKDFSVECVRPQTLKWARDVSHDNVIYITNDLVLEKLLDRNITTDSLPKSRTLIEQTLNEIDNFLNNYEIVMRIPRELKQDDVLGRAVTENEYRLPLSTATGTGRSGFMKKVIIPFLLGLKFKTAVLLPLALALTALKTWKALTLGLLSMVLSGAMLIFKFTKPKQIINYEVLRVPPPPQSTAAHYEHIVEHGPPPVPYWDPHSEHLAYHGHH